jgi:hypothetical protein
MANWQMTCSCGDTMQMDGDSREAAVDKLMAVGMTPEAIEAHMAEKHPGQPVPSASQTRDGLLATATAV